MNADYIAGLEEAYRLMTLNYEIDLAPGRILNRIKQMKTTPDTTEPDRTSMSREQLESALAQREDQLRRVEAQAGAMRECLEDICDKIAQDCLYDPGDVEQFCKRIRYACDSAEAGQSLLARLEEARWIESTLHLISGHTSTPLWIKEKIRDALTPPIDNKCVVPAEKRGVEKGKEELRGSGAQQLNWTTDGFNHRAQGRRRVYWVKTEPLGTNRFRPAIQRGAVTFYCDCPFDKLDDAKVFCQSDHDSVCDIALEESEEKLELMKTQVEARLKESAKDWADDDTAIREICKPYLSGLELNGDSYGVPTMIEVVRRAVDKVEAQCAAMRDLLKVEGCIDPNCGGKGWYSAAAEGPHGDPIEEQVQCQWCFEKSLALCTDCGKSILARLEEARWLIGGAVAELDGGPFRREGWILRRDSWLSGHTPTGDIDDRAAEI